MKKISTKHDLNSALLGIILFDGNMPNNHSLYMRHGGKQLSYVDEKVEYISKYLTPTSLRSSTDNNGFDYRYAYYNNYILQYLYKNIYINNKKRLTKTIMNRFNEITLAMMYMDDGCLVLRRDMKYDDVYKSREIYLSVHSFTVDEVKMLQNQLRLRWGVNFHLSYDKGLPRLWCNTQNTLKFLEIVAPIVKEFPTMHYKLDLKYKTKKISFL